MIFLKNALTNSEDVLRIVREDVLVFVPHGPHVYVPVQYRLPVHTNILLKNNQRSLDRKLETSQERVTVPRTQLVEKSETK